MLVRLRNLMRWVKKLSYTSQKIVLIKKYVFLFIVRYISAVSCTPCKIPFPYPI
jgi:hypothetical protein